MYSNIAWPIFAENILQLFFLLPQTIKRYEYCKVFTVISKLSEMF